MIYQSRSIVTRDHVPRRTCWSFLLAARARALSRSSRAGAAGGGDASGGAPISAPLEATDVVPRGGVCGRACVFTQVDALYEPTCGAQQG